MTVAATALHRDHDLFVQTQRRRIGAPRDPAACGDKAAVLLRLQRSAGNGAVSALVERRQRRLPDPHLRLTPKPETLVQRCPGCNGTCGCDQDEGDVTHTTAPVHRQLDDEAPGE